MLTKRSAGAVGLVALASVALSLAGGGFSPQATAGATIVIWWAVLVGLIRLGWSRSTAPAAVWIALTGIVALVAVTALSVNWAEDAGRAYDEAMRAFFYLGLFVALAVAVDRSNATGVTVGITVGAALVTLLALGSRLTPALLTGDLTIQAESRIGGALSWPVGYWNGLAAIAATALVGAAWLGAAAPRRRLRAGGAAVIPAAVAVILLAQSRGGAFAAAAGLVAVAVAGRRTPALAGTAALGIAAAVPAAIVILASGALTEGLGSTAAKRQGLVVLALLAAGSAAAAYGRFSLDRKLMTARAGATARRAAATAAAVAFVIVTVLIAGNSGGVLDAAVAPPPSAEAGDRTLSGALLNTSGNGRFQLWASALQAFDSSPLRGIGAGGFEYWWNGDPDATTPTRHAHSLWLQTLGELGVIGGLALVLLFSPVAMALGGWRGLPAADPRLGALGIAVTGLVAASFEWTWQLPAVFAPVIAAVVIVAAAGTNGRETPRPRARVTGEGAVAALAALAAISLAVPVFLGERAIDRGRELARLGATEEAVAEITDATALEPLSARPWIELALVQEGAGAYRQSLRSLGEAIERSPLDPVPHFLAARVIAARGRPGDLERYYAELRRALELSPGST